MEDGRLSAIASYENWVKSLNRNTKYSAESKIKPKVPSSLIEEKEKRVKREKKITTSEIWLG